MISLQEMSDEQLYLDPLLNNENADETIIQDSRLPMMIPHSGRLLQDENRDIE